MTGGAATSRCYPLTAFRPQSPDELLIAARRDGLPCLICGRRHTSAAEVTDYHEALAAAVRTIRRRPAGDAA